MILEALVALIQALVVVVEVTNFDVMMNALGEMTKENSVGFTENMSKVGEVFDGVKAECTEEQIQQLGDKLNSVSGCINGLAEEIDKSGYLGMNDDELFAMFFFQKILEQVS